MQRYKKSSKTANLLFYCMMLIFLFTTNHIVYSQSGITKYAGARALSTGGVSVSFMDENAIFSNQAGLAFAENISFSAFGQRRYLLADGMNDVLFGAILPFNDIGTFGLAIEHFGFEAYNEQKFGLAYGRKLSKRLSIGAQFNYLATRIRGYGTSHVFTFELGLQALVSKQLSLAFHVINPTLSSHNNGDRLPSLFRFGARYKPFEDATILVELNKNLTDPFNVRFGFEYQLHEKVYARTGFSVYPTEFSLGLGIHFKSLRIDFGSAYDIYLGFSPGLSVSYLLIK